MNIRCLLFAALLLCPPIAQAQTQVLIINQTLVDNTNFFGPGDYTLTSAVIIQ
jgi:hypothetical protein